MRGEAKRSAHTTSRSGGWPRAEDGRSAEKSGGLEGAAKMTAAGERCKKQGSSIGKVSPLWQTLLLLVRGASRLSDTRGEKLEGEKTAGDGD